MADRTTKPTSTADAFDILALPAEVGVVGEGVVNSRFRRIEVQAVEYQGERLLVRLDINGKVYNVRMEP